MSVKISQLTSGVPAQVTDLVPIARAGVNYSLTAVSIAALGSGPRPNRGNWHGWSCNGVSNASGAVCYSDQVQIAWNGGATFGEVPATATEPQYYTVVTGPSGPTGCSGMYNSPQYGGFTVGILASAMQRIMISSAADCRYWVGAIDSSIGTPIGANDLAFDILSHNFIGFRYSAGAGDTHWMAVTCNGVSQTTVDTGFAPDTAHGHVFEMQGSSGNVVFLIDGAVVATVSTNVPTVVLRIINDTENLSGAPVTLSVAYMYWETTV